jgi:hypothetical protein
MAAKVVLGREASSSATFNLKILHWLPIQANIDYKILLLVFKCINNEALDYLCELTWRYINGRIIIIIRKWKRNRPKTTWKRTSTKDLTQMGLTREEAKQVAQNRPIVAAQCSKQR